MHIARPGYSWLCVCMSIDLMFKYLTKEQFFQDLQRQPTYWHFRGPLLLLWPSQYWAGVLVSFSHQATQATLYSRRCRKCSYKIEGNRGALQALGIGIRNNQSILLANRCVLFGSGCIKGLNNAIFIGGVLQYSLSPKTDWPMGKYLLLMDILITRCLLHNVVKFAKTFPCIMKPIHYEW